MHLVGEINKFSALIKKKKEWSTLKFVYLVARTRAVRRAVRPTPPDVFLVLYIHNFERTQSAGEGGGEGAG